VNGEECKRAIIFCFNGLIVVVAVSALCEIILFSEVMGQDAIIKAFDCQHTDKCPIHTGQSNIIF